MKNNARYQDFLKQITINVNGEVLPYDQAKISVLDRGFLYGDSIYEVTYGQAGHLVFFDEHLARLHNSANLLNMEVFLEDQQIKSEIIKTIKASGLRDVYVRFILTRGESEITLDPEATFDNNFVIIVKPKPEYAKELYTKGLNLIISDVLRNDRRSTNPNAKSGNYLNNVMAMKQAKQMGADDAIMTNKDGDITEGTTFNVWCIKNGAIYTPPEKSGLLKGITRQKVIELAKENGFDLRLETFKSEFLLNADEAFITSSTKGLMPIYKINNKTYEAKRIILTELDKLYQEKLAKEFQRTDNCYL